MTQPSKPFAESAHGMAQLAHGELFLRAGRRRIAAAQRARWARVKSGKNDCRQADNASVWMTALAAPNECVYFNGCGLLLLGRTDVVGAGRGLQFFQTDCTNPLVIKSKNQI
jgi:hypothetical protein